MKMHISCSRKNGFVRLLLVKRAVFLLRLSPANYG